MENTIMAKDQQTIYQWIKGDRFGDVVTVAADQKDNKWLYFEDGSRINPSLVSEYLMQVESPEKVLKVSEVNEVPEKPVEALSLGTTPPVAAQVEEVAVKEPSIMGKMIMKMSKKNVVNVPLQININIPTPALYAMLSEGMEEEDLNEEIMEVALQQIEINNLAEYLKENISTFLSEYYS